MKNSVNERVRMDYDYDYQNDSLFLYVNEDYEYKKSLRLDEDLILDFDKDNVPVALEILHASKRFRTDRSKLKNPIALKMDIEIGEKSIQIKADFKIIIRNKDTSLILNAEGENSINVPSIATQFSAVA